MKLDELRKQLCASPEPELVKPPIGKIPHCAGCMKRLDKCDALVTCKGFLSGEQVEMLDVGAEVLERMRSNAPDERELIIKAALVDDPDEPITAEQREQLRKWYRDDIMTSKSGGRK